MTYKEVIQQAQRELGFTEEEIKRGSQFASLNAPNDVVDRQAKLKPGKTERELIDGFKELFQKMRSDPKFLEEMIRIRCDHVDKVREGN